MGIGLQPAAWHDVYSVVATAAAALLGLFFVAISLHLDDVERNPSLRMRARNSFTALVLILTLSLAVLVPGQSIAILGAEWLVVMVVYYTLLAIGVWRVHRTGGRFRRQIWIRLIVQNLIPVLPVATGISLILGEGPGLFLQIPAILLTIPTISFNAWSVVFAPELRERDRSGGR
jgi:modulator of FtsH protease